AGGSVSVGDRVLVQPAGIETTVSGIDLGGAPQESASAPASVSIQLADDIDAGRGSMIADADDPPTLTRELVADLCWMNEEGVLRPRQQLLLKTSTQRVRAAVAELLDRLDIETLERVGEPPELALNE